MRRVMVTGAATWTGGRLVQALESTPATAVDAVDEVPPQLKFSSPFTQLALDQLAFADHLRSVRPHTVIHLQALDRDGAVGSRAAHTGVVIGAQALIGAIARTEETKRLVVKSDSAVYGAGPRNASVCSEDTEAHGKLSRYQRDLVEMEASLEELADLRPDLDTAILRFAPIIGPTVANSLSRFLRLGVVPTRLGYDPRLQFIHEDDAVGVLLEVATRTTSGTFNVAAPGQLYMSRVLRLGRRPSQPLLERPYRAALRALARLDLSLPPDVESLLQHGRVMSTTLMTERLGVVPKLTCRQTVLATYGRVPATAAP